jgi:AsmA protein
MKKFLIALLVLVLLVIGGLLAAPFLIPVDTYKQQIAKQVEQATGRALAIDGPVSLSLLPSVAVEADQVRLANVAGAAESDMVRLEALEVELKVLPLLSGSVEVDRFVLIQPEIHLEVDQDGRGNWELRAPGGEEAPADAETAPTAPGDEGGGGLPIGELKLGDIRIEDGTITLRDATSGVNERIENVNLSIQLPDLQSRLQAAGSLVYKENTVEIDLAVDQPLAVIQGDRSPLTVAVESEPVVFSFDGLVRSGADQGAQGALELDVRSIRDLAAWLAQPIDYEAEGLRALKIVGKLDAAPTMVNFTDAAITLDDITAEGDFSADISGPKPRLTGTLEVSEVDLNKYMPPAKEGQDAGEGDDAGADDGEADASSGWSNEPIPIPRLDMAEIDFALGVAGIRMDELELGRAALDLALKDAVLDARMTEFALYGGSGEGTFRLDTGKRRPAITTSFKLEGLQALPFLTAAAEFERIEGTVGADFQLETSGRSERGFVSNLGGRGEVLFADGAIVGINLAQMVRNIGAAFAGGNGVQKTDFAELGGSFQIDRGVLTNDDLRLQAPVLRLAGSGTVNIKKRTLDYRIEPKAAPTLEGQGGASDVAGILVPVNVTGTFDDPTFEPDLAAALGSVGETGEAVQKQIKQLEKQKDRLEEAAKSGDVEGLVGGVSGLLGGDKKKDGKKKEGATADQPEDPAQQLLKGILGN